MVHRRCRKRRGGNTQRRLPDPRIRHSADPGGHLCPRSASGGLASLGESGVARIRASRMTLVWRPPGSTPNWSLEPVPRSVDAGERRADRRTMRRSRGMLPSRAGRAGVAAGLVACLPLLSVPGAAAEQTTASDPAGDVVRVRDDAGPNGNDTVARLRPERARGDLRRLHANHAHERVVMRLRYRDLNALGTVGNYYEFRTGRARFSLWIDWTRKHPDPVFGDFNDDTHNIVVDCPGLTAENRPAEDRFRLDVPRSCLNNPKWVRVGAETWTGSGYVDDALRRGRSVIGWQEGPVLGPRLARGPVA